MRCCCESGGSKKRYNLEHKQTTLQLPLFTVFESNPDVPLGKDKTGNMKECKELRIP